ncbi:MAG TPA: P-loop NTPase [Actinomycetota bacterium]|nr:P-loop NTPase [Actinomycetota bacterium]
MSVDPFRSNPPGERLGRPLLTVLLRRIWVVAAVTAAVTGLAIAYSFLQTPVYQATTRVFVTLGALSPQTYVQGLVPMESEKELAESFAVTTLAARSLRTAEKPLELLGNLDVGVSPNTQILVFNYSAPDPVSAQEGSRIFAESYLEYRRVTYIQTLLASARTIRQQAADLEGQLQDVRADLDDAKTRNDRFALRAQAKALADEIGILRNREAEMRPSDELATGHIVEPPRRPTAPVSPSLRWNALLGLIMGLALGSGGALVRERLDQRIVDTDELEELSGAPLLGAIPNLGRKKPVLPTLDAPHSEIAEAYRILRERVSLVAFRREVGTILITSAVESEGKSTVAANLAIALRQVGKKVTLVSADLRKPRLEELFKVPNHRGLSDVLFGYLSTEAVLTPASFNGSKAFGNSETTTSSPPAHPAWWGPAAEKGSLNLMASGPLPANPAELLASSKIAAVIDQLRRRSDYVIIDGPPLLPVADALTMAYYCDGVILVTDGTRTTGPQVTQARRLLKQVHATIIGVVLNRFDKRNGVIDAYGYAPFTQPPAPKPEDRFERI